tara:strand:- start:299 stop:538 length:240 start_codon:yes stop_codon:yes gene_type:complete
LNLVVEDLDLVLEVFPKRELLVGLDREFTRELPNLVAFTLERLLLRALFLKFVALLFIELRLLVMPLRLFVMPLILLFA